MNEKKIIVISGKQFSGKDTVANMLQEMLKDFKRVPLAYAIKKEFGEKKNLTLQEIERNKPLYRAELIQLGNKRRKEDPDYWLKKVLTEEGNIIVSDIRLKHELEMFKTHDSITIRVNSDRKNRAERGTLVREDDLTETDLDDIQDWDYVIENNSDFESLKKKVKKLVKSIEESLYSGAK
jgi:phosphomevalonate kinase